MTERALIAAYLAGYRGKADALTFIFHKGNYFACGKDAIVASGFLANFPERLPTSPEAMSVSLIEIECTETAFEEAKELILSVSSLNIVRPAE